MKIHHVSIFALALYLTACSTTFSPRLATTPVERGMRSDQVLAAFGRPLSIERNSNGGEDWYYHFGTQSKEARTVSESTSAPGEVSSSINHETTVITTMNKLPIHISDDGHVVGEIPEGNVVLE